MDHILAQREYEVQRLQKRIEREKQLLDRLESGLLDGVIRNYTTHRKFTHLILIEDGRPMFAKYLTEKGPIKEATIVEKEFETNEGKLWFLRNHGIHMEDVYAQLYSHMYRRPGNP